MKSSFQMEGVSSIRWLYDFDSSRSESTSRVDTNLHGESGEKKVVRLRLYNFEYLLVAFRINEIASTCSS